MSERRILIDAYWDGTKNNIAEDVQATELWNNGSLVSDWNINIDDRKHRFGVVEFYDANCSFP